MVIHHQLTDSLRFAADAEAICYFWIKSRRAFGWVQHFMGRLIDDFLSTTIPPEVWHYTNLRGFEGIVSSGCVGATEAHDTTDKTKYVNARGVAVRYFARLVPKDDGLETRKTTAESDLALFYECRPPCSQPLLHTAAIVRD